MAGKPQMKCGACKMWIPCRAEQLLVPTHYVTKNKESKICPGRGQRPTARKNFPKPNTEKW